MIYWAPFLHFYQPSFQFHSVLVKVCNESYRPLVKMFLEHRYAKVTVNINAVLSESLSEHNAQDIIINLKELGSRGQLEFVESAKFHPILPLIKREEANRQIKLNNQTNKELFGQAYNPKGVFSPEMCYSPRLAKDVASLGYKWVLLSGVAHSGKWPLDFISTLPKECGSLAVFFRDDIISNQISFQNTDSRGFIKELIALSQGKEDIYVITAMDAETFGHHIKDWDKTFLAKTYELIDEIREYNHLNQQEKKAFIQDNKDLFDPEGRIPLIETITISELLTRFPLQETKPPKPSSWSTNKDELAQRDYYPLWKGSGNMIHYLQWEHLALTNEIVDRALNIKEHNDLTRLYAKIARKVFDKAQVSCQFWWANKAKGLWSVNLINKGLMLQEEAALNAFLAIVNSRLSSYTKKEFYYKTAACRVIAGRIRDLIIV
ncbi:MAG: hypothetical protein JW867_09070 [Candidatus Omnitrophica bacterium]|nr:hypothetical protein [Candidatus Omnitrophota bacterium]